MQNISGQVEELCASHGRAYVVEALTKTIMEASLSSVLIPERLIMEQVMLVAIVHGNIGTEVGGFSSSDS